MYIRACVKLASPGVMQAGKGGTGQAPDAIDAKRQRAVAMYHSADAEGIALKERMRQLFARAGLPCDVYRCAAAAFNAIAPATA
jgi:hypothetical protein